MPWFMSKDGSQRVWFSKMPEPAEICGVKFNRGDYACVEENNTVRCLTEDEFLALTKTMTRCNW